MATPMPKPPVYGYAPAPSAGAPTDYLSQPRPAAPSQQPFDINALLALLGGGGQKPKAPPSGAGMGGIGPGPMIMPVNPYQPALPIGMDLPPRAPVLDEGYGEGPIGAIPPQTGMGGMGAMPPGFVPQVTPPAAPEIGPEIYQPRQAQGMDVQKLLAALRAMQGARKPTPAVVPPQVAPTPQGRSPSAGMGLDGLLNAIRASKQR